MNLCVVGMGYVGLVTACAFSQIGHTVNCLDIDEKKINLLSKGISPIYEPNIQELLLNNNALHFTADSKIAYNNIDVIFVCVGTPENNDGSVNLTYLNNVIKDIACNIKKDCVIAIKSTIPIGTTAKIEKKLNSIIPSSINIEVVFNPEFLSQGTALYDTLHGSRIVLGVNSLNSEEIMKKVYTKFYIPYVITNRESAEMIKYAANNFLALKLSYINEIANLCELTGANIEDVTIAIGMDNRIGNHFLNPGIGYGGSCFSKDAKGLQYISNSYGYSLKTIQASIDVNNSQQILLLKKSRKFYPDFKNKTIAILGTSFKPNTDDLRHAPSINNISTLLHENANIQVYDPVSLNNLKNIFENKITYCTSINEALKNADICFIFTEWQEIKKLDINIFEKNMKTPIVLDGRNCFNLDDVKKHNIIYISIGRKTINNYNSMTI